MVLGYGFGGEVVSWCIHEVDGGRFLFPRFPAFWIVDGESCQAVPCGRNPKVGEVRDELGVGIGWGGLTGKGVSPRS